VVGMVYICSCMTCLIGKLPGLRDSRGSRVDRHGFVISSSKDGATYVKP